MRSSATLRFWSAYAKLPSDIRESARKAYAKFRENPIHPGLHFKLVHGQEAVYSVRISRGYRALGILEGGEITWFWIGNHDDYEQLLSDL